MSEHILNFNEEEELALTEMGIADIETYIKNICKSHNTQKINEQLLAKTDEEKKAILEAEQAENKI